MFISKKRLNLVATGSNRADIIAALQIAIDLLHAGFDFHGTPRIQLKLEDVEIFVRADEEQDEVLMRN